MSAITNPHPRSAITSDMLLLTKLLVPPLRERAVVRSRLTERLERSDAQRLTLVTAPPGFGKTSAVVAWLATAKRAAAWITLDPDDSDPPRFWRYLATALEQLHPGLGAPALNLLGPAVEPPVRAAITSLLNQLSTMGCADSCGRPSVLVLDDVHTLSNPALFEQLAGFLDRLPRTLRVVLLSRTDPPLPLARLRAHDALLELRVDDLRMTDAEAAAFLRSTMALDLSDAQVAALEQRTEGWVAALQLAALSLRGTDANRFIAAFTGTNRFIVDYLAEEVIGGLPADDQAFLLETSVLDRLCVELCAAVTGKPAGALIDRLEQAQLFLLPLDQERRWYRYHALFHDLLRFRLQQTAPDQVATLHGRAATWHAEHRMLPEAIRHALQAGMPERAAQWTAAAARSALENGQIGALLGWLTALPAELRRADPRLCIAHAWCLLYTGRLEEVPYTLDQAEAHPNLADDSQAEIAALRAHLARLGGDLDEALARSRRALEAAPERLMLRGFVTMNLAGVARLTGDLVTAAAAYAEAAMWQLRSGNHYLAAVARCLQGDVEAQQGALQRAAATYIGVLEAPTVAGAPPPAAGLAAAGLAHIHYARDERREAEQLLTMALEQGRLHGDIDTLLSALIGQTLLCRARDDRAGASEALDHLDELAHRSGHRQVLLLAKSMRVRVQLRWDAPTVQDRDWAQRYAPTAHPLSIPEVTAQLTAGRVCLSVAGDPTMHAAALERLKRLRACAAQAGHEATHLEALLLEALGHAALDATDSAATAFNNALDLAAGQGQIRLFADVEPALQRLLLPLVARAHPQGAAAQRLLQQIRHALGVDPAPTSQLAEPLSPREHEILGLIAAGLSNEAIAGKLVISVATVKKHGTSLFGKLGVASRTEAVARARALGILP